MSFMAVCCVWYIFMRHKQIIYMRYICLIFCNWSYMHMHCMQMYVVYVYVVVYMLKRYIHLFRYIYRCVCRSIYIYEILIVTCSSMT